MTKYDYRLRKDTISGKIGDVFEYYRPSCAPFGCYFNTRIGLAESQHSANLYTEKEVLSNPDWFEKIEKKTYTEKEVAEIVKYSLDFANVLRNPKIQADSIMQELLEKGLIGSITK